MGLSKATIDKLLEKHKGNNSVAAREAGVSESQWYQYKRLYKIKTLKAVVSPHEQVLKDTKMDNLTSKLKQSEGKYEIVRQENETLKALLEVAKVIDVTNSYTIKPVKHDNASLVTAVAVCSDWHYEETVHRANVNDKNEYNPAIAKERAEMFFVSTVRLLKIFSKESKIETLILALLGDFINGQLREEAMENNSMRPMDATLECWRILSAGINYILDNTDVNLIIPCHSGNHARTTKKTHPSTESGNSLEYILYHGLASEFKDNKRVTFVIPTSYHSYIDVGGFMLRFHHGHAMRYSGGIGGIYISVNKAIAQWNKVQRADLDIFGHFHQLRDGGNFICNGSLIGWNEFANFIKADYEKPKQAFFLIDHERGEKTITAPIFLHEKRKIL